MVGPSYTVGQVVDGRTICGAKKRNLDPCEASAMKGEHGVSIMVARPASDGSGGSRPQGVGNEAA